MEDSASRFQNATFKGLNTLSAWQKCQQINVPRYEASLKQFILHYDFVRGTADDDEYLRRLQGFEDFVKEL